MLVEDSETQAMKMSLLFETEGWEVITIASGEAALQALNRVIPDLLVVDYNLPGIRGDELCRSLRMNVNTRNIPTVMLTAEEGQATELRGLESGADYYISKAADEDILIMRIRKLLEKSHAQSTLVAHVDSNFHQPKILAIDDSPTYLEFLADALNTEGYQVEKSSGGKEGLKRLSDTTFDCVLVDLVMPDIDGIEVAKKITAMRHQLEKPLVVLMLTARETKEDMTRALEAGADDFVGKSSDIAVLKGRIRALLRRKF